MDVITKSEFAAQRGVTPGRVSQWISEGKITGEALVGTGRSAKINVAIAVQQLKDKLDTNQRFGMNGLTTNLSAPEPAPILPGLAPAAGDPVENRIKAEKLRQAELMTRKLEREENEALGVYIRTSDAREEMQRVAGTMMTFFEGAIMQFAGSVAAQFHLTQRDVEHCLQGEFRKVRERAAGAMHQAAADEPELVEDHGEGAGLRETPGV